MCFKNIHADIVQIFAEAQIKVGPKGDGRCPKCNGIFQDGECIECGHSIRSTTKTAYRVKISAATNANTGAKSKKQECARTARFAG